MARPGREGKRLCLRIAEQGLRLYLSQRDGLGEKVLEWSGQLSVADVAKGNKFEIRHRNNHNVVRFGDRLACSPRTNILLQTIQ